MRFHIALFAALSAFLALPLRAADDAVHAKAATPLHISHGAPVDLAQFAVPGKYTVFDFYSEYCPPCRAIAPHLDALHHARADIAVVKIDINRPDHRGIDWKSPVASQHHLRQVPTFVVFGPDGKQQSEGDAAYHQVVSWIEESEKM